MSGNQANNRVCRASEMWVGMRTVFGETSMVVGITVAGETHVFLATPEVFGQFADQIAEMPEALIISDPHGSGPRFLSPNRANGRRVAGVAS